MGFLDIYLWIIKQIDGMKQMLYFSSQVTHFR